MRVANDMKKTTILGALALAVTVGITSQTNAFSDQGDKVKLTAKGFPVSGAR